MDVLPDEVAPGIFRIEVPLPGNPLKAINSYLVRGNERDLVVDTGMRREECRAALVAGLAALDVDLAAADFFITHLHADHYGLVADLATPTSTVYFNEPDARGVSGGLRWDAFADYARRNGFPADLLLAAIQRHPGYRYSAPRPPAFHLVREGDHLAVGDYDFVCVETPGHTPGHTCLYDPAKRLFFSGDAVLEDITPNISLFADGENPLRDYLESLAKIAGLAIDLVLPGHRRVFTGLKRRVAELQAHHRARAEEALTILADGEADA
ncbi:MAG: MBL fold metallo-hydrolase, partial [Chloroflexota bacterium]